MKALDRNISLVIISVLAIVFCTSNFMFLKYMFNIDKLLQNTFYNDVFDSFFNHVIFLFIAVSFIKTSGMEISTLIQMNKKTIYLILVIIIIAIILQLTAREIYKYFFTILPDLGYSKEKKEIIDSLKIYQNKIIFFFTTGIFTPITEEAFMRAYVYRVFRNKYGIIMTIITNSIIFTIFHAIPSIIPGIILVNIILCLSFEYSKSLVIPIVLHATYNSYSIFF